MSSSSIWLCSRLRVSESIVSFSRTRRWPLRLRFSVPALMSALRTGASNVGGALMGSKHSKPRSSWRSDEKRVAGHGCRCVSLACISWPIFPMLTWSLTDGPFRSRRGKEKCLATCWHTATGSYHATCWSPRSGDMTRGHSTRTCLGCGRNWVRQAPNLRRSNNSAIGFWSRTPRQPRPAENTKEFAARKRPRRHLFTRIE